MKAIKNIAFIVIAIAVSLLGAYMVVENINGATLYSLSVAIIGVILTLGPICALGMRFDRK